MRRILSARALFAPVLFALAAAAARAEEPALSASRTVIVVTDSAEALAGTESLGRIPPGSVLRYSDENGPWLLIPRYQGWLNREHVVALERAVPFFNDIIARTPVPQAFHHRGIAHLSLGDYNAAIADFTRAITEGLSDPGVYVNRGVARQRRGDHQAAIEDFTRAIQLDPNNARAYDNRAGALAELNRLDASLADSNEAIRISPRFAEAYNNRGVTWRLKGDYQRAFEDYSRAIELFEGYSAAYANRGYVHKQLGDAASAIADYEQAIALDPLAPGAFNDLAWLLATSRDDDVRDGMRAVELAERACQLTRNQNADCLDTLAAALAEQGDFAAAVAKAREAAALTPEDLRPVIERRLARYASQQPWREE